VLQLAVRRRAVQLRAAAPLPLPVEIRLLEASLEQVAAVAPPASVAALAWAAAPALVQQ